MRALEPVLGIETMIARRGRGRPPPAVPRAGNVGQALAAGPELNGRPAAAAAARGRARVVAADPDRHHARRPTARGGLSIPIRRASAGRYHPRPVPDVAALTRNAVKVLPEGELERKLALGPAAAGQARHRPDRPRHPHRPGHPAAAHARVPGRRATSGVLIVGDYTARVGDPSGRSKERRLLSDEEIDAQRRARYFEQALPHPRPPTAPSFASTPSGWASSTSRSFLRLTRTMTVSRHARAKRLREALPHQPADLDLGVPVPAHAGLRLGGRSRPTSSWAAPTRSTTCSPAATSRSPTARSRRWC